MILSTLLVKKTVLCIYIYKYIYINIYKILHIYKMKWVNIFQKVLAQVFTNKHG